MNAPETLAEARRADLQSTRKTQLIEALRARTDAQNRIDTLVLQLRWKHGLSWAELAEMLGVTPQAVQQKYRRK